MQLHCSGAAEGLLVQSFLQDIGFVCQVQVKTHSSAGIAIASRLGLGKLKHVEIKFSHVQQLVQASRIKLAKVPSADNPSDLGTKYLDKARLDYLKQLVGIF